MNLACLIGCSSSKSPSWVQVRVDLLGDDTPPHEPKRKMHQWNQIEVYRSSNSSRSTSNMGERACVGALVPSQRDCPFTALSIAGLSVRRRNFREERVVRDRDACHCSFGVPLPPERE